MGWAVFCVDCDPLRTKAWPARLVAVLAEVRVGVAFLFRSTGVIGFLGRRIASSRVASGCHVGANAPVSPEVRSSGVTDPLDPCHGRNSQSTPSEAWVVTPRRIHVVPACRVMHNVRAPGGAGQNERDD